MKILVTLSSFAKFSPEPLEQLKKAGLEVVTNPFSRTLSPEECLKFYAPDINGVIAGTEKVTEEVMKKANSLRVISRCGSGLDGINLAAAAEHNIRVFKTSVSLSDAVAELSLGLILNALRFISLADRSIRADKWDKPMGYLLKGKTLGVIGSGNIGKRLIELCAAFDLKILAYDIRQDQVFAQRHNVKYIDLKPLISQSDIVSIHLPLTPETENLIDADMLKLMKADALLVNTSRADIIDEQALYKALKEKRIVAAALDVFSQEPYRGPLKELDNVVLTSHIGSYAREVRIRMETEAVDNLLKGLK